MCGWWWGRGGRLEGNLRSGNWLSGLPASAFTSERSGLVFVIESKEI